MREVGRYLAVAIPLFASTVASTSALAQTEDPRALFEEGTRALAEERHADAESALRRSLELDPRASVAYNLALALQGLGRIREAIAVTEDNIVERYGALPEGMDEALRVLVRDLRASVATLVLSGAGDTSAVTFSIDDHRIGEVAVGVNVEHEVDPGPHEVVAEASTGEAVRRRVVVDPGERRELVLRLPTTSPSVEEEPTGRREDTDPLDPAPETRESEEGGASPWAFVAIGAAVVAIGAAVLIGVLVASSSSPEADPVFGNTEVLSLGSF